MHFYFILQYKRFKRKLISLGLNPYLGMVLISCIFIGLSLYLFQKTGLASWIYLFLGLSFVLQFSNTSRNQYLKTTFKRTDFIRIRMLENLVVVLPFCFYLLYKSALLEALILLIVSIVILFFNQSFASSKVIPTPFRKIPFEFIVGFRKSIVFLPIVLIVLYQAVKVGNFNLGIFSLALVFLMSLSFYSTPEQPYFVWIYNTSSKHFLFKKIYNGLVGVSIFAMPVLIVLLWFFPDQFFILIGVQIGGYTVLSTIVLAKYSAFPKEISLPQGILFALCVWFPPTVLIAIPLFYKQAIKRLKLILE